MKNLEDVNVIDSNTNHESNKVFYILAGLEISVVTTN